MRRQRTRKTRAERAIREAVAAPSYITRKIPFVNYLDEEGLVRLEEQADWIIKEIGIEFREDPVALEIWKKAGADVKETRVRLPEGMARELSRSAPSSFVQHSRNPARNVKIGEDNSVFAPVYGPPFVRDLEGGRRYGTIEDFNNLVKLTYMLPSLHHSGFVTCEPCDIPVNKRHLDMVYAHLRYGDQPFMGSVTAPERAEDSITMAKIGSLQLSTACCRHVRRLGKLSNRRA